MKAARMTLGLLLLAAGPGAAQSLPPVTKAKAAATKAVESANARTAAQTGAADSAAKARAPRDTATGRSTRSASGATADAPAPSVSFQRESFRYDRGGRRDPFVSLMNSGELRPLITDLQVLVIVHDPDGRASVAVLRDASTKEQYRVRVGTSIGRVRVARIDPKSVTFTIEEFGFSRQETLALGDPNKEKTQ